jgi:hypothetical protein
VRDGDEARARRDRREDRLRLRLDDDDRAPGRVQWSDQPEVLVGGRDHLVALFEPEPGEDDVASIRGRRGERDLSRRDPDESRDVGT